MVAENRRILVLIVFHLICISWSQRLNINPNMAVQAHNDARRKVAAGKVPGQPAGTIPDLVTLFFDTRFEHKLTFLHDNSPFRCGTTNWRILPTVGQVVATARDHTTRAESTATPCSARTWPVGRTAVPTATFARRSRCGSTSTRCTGTREVSACRLDITHKYWRKIFKTYAENSKFCRLFGPKHAKLVAEVRCAGETTS